MSWLQALHEQDQSVEGLADLPWSVVGGGAVADLDRLARTYMRGTTLVVEPAPEPLPWVNRLRDVGWHRRTLPVSVPGWIIAADYLVDGARLLRVQGYTSKLPDGTDWHDAEPHSSMDYFSPPPPPLGRSKVAKALAQEWQDRLRRSDWDGWTATPFIEAKTATPEEE